MMNRVVKRVVVKSVLFKSSLPHLTNCFRHHLDNPGSLFPVGGCSVRFATTTAGASNAFPEEYPRMSANAKGDHLNDPTNLSREELVPMVITLQQLLKSTSFARPGCAYLLVRINV